MSRITKNSIFFDSFLNVKYEDNYLTIKNKDSFLSRKVNNKVSLNIYNKFISVSPLENSKYSKMQAGTYYSLIKNMVMGLTVSFKKKLKLFGVGYKVSLKNNILILDIGFSHSINYVIPFNVNVVLPSSVDIVLSSIDKELLGRVACEIRGYRVPESYKGKGIRYCDENVVLKETKKK